MNRILYLGLDLPDSVRDRHVVHCPLIEIVPRSKDDPGIIASFSQLQDFTHLIFTSKSGVSIFMEYAPHFGIAMKEISSKCLIAVGKQTAAKITSFGASASIIAKNETGEGVIEELSYLDLTKARVFWPHSSLSRPLIAEWLASQQIPFVSCPFYDTIPRIPNPVPDLSPFNEIVFTSPSVVDVFFSIYKTLPQDKILTSIGPITQKKLDKLLSKFRKGSNDKDIQEGQRQR